VLIVSKRTVLLVCFLPVFRSERFLWIDSRRFLNIVTSSRAMLSFLVDGGGGFFSSDGTESSQLAENAELSSLELEIVVDAFVSRPLVDDNTVPSSSRDSTTQAEEDE